MTEVVSKNTAIDFSSPYYLHPSDHPGLVICPVTFKGYDEWVITMRKSLRAKRKLGFVNGTITRPAASATSSPMLDDWHMVYWMLFSWIMQSIDSSLRSSVIYFESVKDLWDDLRQRFCVGNRPRKLQLRSEIANCRQAGLNVSAYFNTFKKLWDELSTYIPLRKCSCGKYECDLNSFWTAAHEEERVHQFLIGLDDVSFGSLRSNLMAMDPLPSLNRVYALAIQEERMKTVVLSRDPPIDSMAHAARQHRLNVHSSSSARFTGTFRSPSKRKDITCDHCHEKGHDKSKCFKLHGYPDWIKEKWAARDAAREVTRTSSVSLEKPSHGTVNAVLGRLYQMLNGQLL